MALNPLEIGKGAIWSIKILLKGEVTGGRGLSREYNQFQRILKHWQEGHEEIYLVISSHIWGHWP